MLKLICDRFSENVLGYGYLKKEVVSHFQDWISAMHYHRNPNEDINGKLFAPALL
jgi:hypothetical protein